MSDDVQIGEDGWLFLKGGSNNAEDYYTEQSAFPAEKLNQWRDLLDSRNSKCAAMGIRFIHFLAPDKTSVYPEFYGRSLPNFLHHPIRLFDSILSGRDYWVNVLPHILDEKAKSPLFYKTDSHWNFTGCYAAYSYICNRLGVQPNETLPTRPRSRVELVMDLGNKLSPPVSESAEFFHMLRDAKRAYANCLVEFNESPDAKKYGLSLYNSVVTFKNDSSSAVQSKVLLFGDSFCEFRPHMMTGMFAETFREFTFVWNHSVDFDYVREHKPDILITENVERFVNRVPVDGVDIVQAANDRMKEIGKKRAADSGAQVS